MSFPNSVRVAINENDVRFFDSHHLSAAVCQAEPTELGALSVSITPLREEEAVPVWNGAKLFDVWKPPEWLQKYFE